jgi:hypothetical protein
MGEILLHRVRGVSAFWIGAAQKNAAGLNAHQKDMRMARRAPGFEWYKSKWSAAPARETRRKDNPLHLFIAYSRYGRSVAQ